MAEGFDETTRGILEKITISYKEPTPIPSGYLCTVFFDCIRLTPNDLARLAAQATGHLPERTFEYALGIAYTGIFFAAAVAGGHEVGIFKPDGDIIGPSIAGKRVVITDDVVFKGGRMKRAQEAVEQAGGIVTGFACIVDRSGDPNLFTGKPLWSAVQAEMI